MTNDNNDLEATDDAEFEPDEAQTAEPAQLEPPEDTDTDDTPEKAARSGNGIAWLALILALAAAALVGYTVVSDLMSGDDSALPELNAAVDEIDRRSRENAEAVSAVDARFGRIQHPDYSGEIDALRREFEEQLQLTGSLAPRMATVENSLAALAGISQGARETFLLAEAEYYLQIANAQLQLASNPALATLALGMADERVTQMSDPGLTDVRRAISNEMAALDVLEKPDLEGATLTLASLARVVESLPIAVETTEDQDEATGDEEQSAASRAWSSVKGAVSGLVKVTPPDEAKLEQLSPDAEQFLRNNIALQLQSARLALLRGEQSIFEQTLDDTVELIETYFDVGSEPVIGALTTITEVREQIYTSALPDISGSLRLLRQYRTLREQTE